jgi:hypothetical protein
MRATLLRHGLAIATEHVAILPGALGADVVAIGGAVNVLQEVFSAPALVSIAAGVDSIATRQPILAVAE